MDITFEKTPELFGTFHIVSVLIILLSCIPVYHGLKKCNEAVLLKFLHYSGLLMIIMEIWKQWFSYVYVYNHVFSMWFFPWQLCSMAMYCSFFIPYFKEKFQNTLLVFLATYSLFAAIMALAVPADMLRPQILLTCHGFIYHGIMLYQSIAAMLVVYRRKNISFIPATYMFLIMAAIAEIINVVSHHVLQNWKLEPNMFNITPYYPSTQFVFHEIALAIGIIPQLIIYLLLIIISAGLLFVWQKNRFTKEKD